MITANVIQRTYHIRFGDTTGTAFTIDRDNKQYLATARHLVEGVTTGSIVDLYHEQQWKRLPVNVVGIGTRETDVAVLASWAPLLPQRPLEPSSAGLQYGQQIYFTGYPFGWHGGGEDINYGFPIPFVKAGIVSACIGGEVGRVYLDAHGNRGFSGGPVVFANAAKQFSDFQVAGVVVAEPRPRKTPVVGRDGSQVASVAENQGFVVATDIRHVTELIDANPIGLHSP